VAHRELGGAEPEIILNGEVDVFEVQIFERLDREENMGERLFKDFNTLESLAGVKADFYQKWLSFNKIKIDKSVYYKILDRLVKSRQDVEFLLFDKKMQGDSILPKGLLSEYLKNNKHYKDILKDINLDVIEEVIHNVKYYDIVLDYEYKGERAYNYEILKDKLKENKKPLILYFEKYSNEVIDFNNRLENMDIDINKSIFVPPFIYSYKKFRDENSYKIPVYEKTLKKADEIIQNYIKFFENKNAYEIAEFINKHRFEEFISSIAKIASNKNQLTTYLYKKLNQPGPTTPSEVRLIADAIKFVLNVAID
jgi:hypothetical protein